MQPDLPHAHQRLLSIQFKSSCLACELSKKSTKEWEKPKVMSPNCLFCSTDKLQPLRICHFCLLNAQTIDAHNWVFFNETAQVMNSGNETEIDHRHESFLHLTGQTHWAVSFFWFSNGHSLQLTAPQILISEYIKEINRPRNCELMFNNGSMPPDVG